MVEMKNLEPLKCPNCGAELEFDYAYNTDGGFDDGYYLENGHYICNQCHKEYIAQLFTKFTNFRYDNIEEEYDDE